LKQPALVGGLVMGVLTALPIISGGNLCCCLWVVSGGVLAAYMLQQAQPTPIRIEDGALVGLAAGIVGAFVYLIVSIPVSIVIAPFERMMMERVAERMADMPPEFRAFATSYAGGGFRLILGFLFWLFVGGIFSTLGGLLGAAIFKKGGPPAPAVPPSDTPLPPTPPPGF
jgi:hypothetical protein